MTSLQRNSTKDGPAPYTEYRVLDSGGRSVYITDMSEEIYIIATLDRDNKHIAERMVRCVNAHDELVEVLEESLSFVECVTWCAAIALSEQCDCGAKWTTDRINAAIAKARGES